MGFEAYAPHQELGKTTEVVPNDRNFPAIRLSRHSLTINKWAREFFCAANVELAFDPETKTIRIGPGGTFTLKNSRIYARGFFKAFGITSVGLFPVEFKEGHLYARLF